METRYYPYLIMLAVNASVSLSTLFVPLLAKDVGLSLADIGIIGSAYGISSFFSYTIFGRLTDVTGKGKKIIRAGLILGAFSFGMQIYMRDFPTMIVLRGLAGAAVGMCTFPLFSYISKASNYREKIGWLAGFGSLGWAIGYFTAGVVGRWKEGFLISGIFFLFGFLVSFRLGEGARGNKNGGSIRSILTRNFPLYFSYFLRHTGANAVWVIFPVFLKEELATPVIWMGILYVLNTGSQFLWMGILGRKAEKWGGDKIFKFGLALSAPAFLLLSAVTSYLQVIPIMLMIGVAWSCMYVGALVHLLEKNVESATSTGMLGSAMSLSGIFGPALGGFISNFAGMRMNGIIGGGLALAGLGISYLIR